MVPGWMDNMEFCQDLITDLMHLRRNKLPNFQKDLRAVALIQTSTLGKEWKRIAAPNCSPKISESLRAIGRKSPRLGAISV